MPCYQCFFHHSEINKTYPHIYLLLPEARHPCSTTLIDSSRGVYHDQAEGRRKRSRVQLRSIRWFLPQLWHLSLCKPQPSRPRAGGVIESGNDFAALGQLIPHLVYGWMSWVCVLIPNAATFETVKPLLSEAYDLARQIHLANWAGTMIWSRADVLRYGKTQQ